MKQYKGWLYGYYPNAPETSKWQATRFGVGLNAGTEEAIRRLIDLKTI
jgi:hypothetical protein